MTLATDLFAGKVIDLQSKEVRSCESLIKKGDWYFAQLGNYTSASPLTVVNNTTAKITFQPEDIIYTNSNSSFSTNYDFINQKFLPRTLNDLFAVEIRFKFRAVGQDGHFDVMIESPDFEFNPVSGTTVTSTKAAGVEQFCALNFKFFIGQDLIDNGLEFKISPVSTSIEIYDVSYLTIRLCSGK